MNKMKKTDWIILAVIAALIAFIAFMVTRGGKTETKKSGTAGGGDTAPVAVSETPKELTYRDYNGKKMGIITGTSFEEPTLTYFPDSEYLYYNSYNDTAMALAQGSVDGFLGDEPALRMMCKENKSISYLPEKLVNDNYAFGFTKDNEKTKKLREQFNEMLAELKTNGTLDEMGDKWFGDDESVKTCDLDSLTGEQINIVTTSTDLPFSYIKDNKNVGFAIELLERFCRKYGYKPNIEDVDFSARIPGLVSNKYDMCVSSLSITPERQESIDFSEPIYEGGIVIAVRIADAGGQTASQPAASVKTVKDYAGKKIGVQTGTVFDEMIKENIPDAEISYYNSYTDLLQALKSGIIDGFATDEPIVKYMMSQDSSVNYLSDKMDDYSFGFAFPKDDKGAALCNEFSEYIKKIKSDGTLAEIDSIWFGSDESKKIIPDTSELSGEKGMLSLAVEAANAPFVYLSNNKIVGYEIDMAYRFCKEYGYGLELVDMNFDGIIPAVSSGKNDFGASTITITEERRESVNFSEPHYDGGSVLAVRTEDLNSTASTDAPASSEISYTEFNGKRMGIRTGSNFEPITLEKFPDSEYLYFDNDSDLIQALQANKIDAFLDDEPVAAMVHVEQPDVNYLKKPLVDDDYHFCFQKDTERSEKLRGEFNALLAELKSSGELDKMKEKWLGSDESAKTYDDSGLTGENGEISVVVMSDNVPFAYIANNKLQGYVVELVTMLARRGGYSIKFEQANLASGLAGLTSGKYDIFAGSISYTEERAQSIDYSDVIYNGGVMLVARTEDIGTSEAAPAAATASGSEPSYTAYNGKRIGIKTGSSFEPVTLEEFPDSEHLYFDNLSDLIAALQNDKIDGFLEDEPTLRMACLEQKDITYLQNEVKDDKYRFGFQKQTESSLKLQSEFNAVVAKLNASGELDKMKEKWFSEDESVKDYDDSGLSGENGEIVVAVNPDKAPFSYMAGDKLMGYSVELVTIFARECGYSIRYEYGNLAACIAGLTTGKYDVIAGCLSITEERKQSMDFSDSIYDGGMVLAVRTADLAAAASSPAEKSTSDSASNTEETVEDKTFFGSIKESFNKNFIREDRYKLILEGIRTTCIITALSVIFGSLLAFLICLFRRADSVLSGKISDLYVKLLQGTPMVVLLMILYYVIFGKSGIAAMWVAVIGFSLNFGAYVSEILRSGIESIDGGQREAALALGYSENQAFFRFIFPQAAVRQIPVYRGEIISLLKNTSIVGYIAIQDLTKMSDIIRSRTYEAFFPLIVTAVIYFILAWVISLILKIVLKQIDPRSKKRGVKGVAKK